MSKTPNTPSLDFSPPMKPKEETGAEFKARQVAKAQEAAETATEIKDAPDTWQALEKAQEEGRLVLTNIPTEEVVKTRPAPTAPSNAFEELQREAIALSKSGLLPDIFKNNVPNCMIAIDLARTSGISGLLIAQNIQIIKGKPGLSTQFATALFNLSNKWDSLDYDFRGEDGPKEQMSCRCYATKLSTGEVKYGSRVNWAMVAGEGWTSNSKWNTMPEQMMRYRAASFFIKAHAPEVLLGMSSAEELQDVAAAQTNVVSDGTKALADTFKK